MSNYNSIDLYELKKIISEYAYINEAKEYILDEEVDFNPLVIKNKLKLTKEALNLLINNFNCSFDGIENIDDILDKASKDCILSPLELSKVLVFSSHVRRIKDLFNKINEELSIKDFTDSLFVDNGMENEISKAVDPFGNFKDDASPKLKDINREIEKSEKNLYSQAHSFINLHKSALQEESLFIRNNRISFLVKNSDKNKFQGYQYGSSASGLSTYVEPSQFVELNNHRLALEEEKEEEIKTILRNLTYVVSINSESYKNNFSSLIQLNVVFAKAQFGFNKHGVIPTISDNNELHLNNVDHPLIDFKRVISNTYNLSNNYRGIVISGTNTGGKTIGLKTIGLSVIMAYLGIPVLCEKAEIPLFNNIYIDIDDNQSIANSLSTFSAHISNINNILNNANSKSLILIDELISGTDPKEAQAISLAILDRIEQLGSRFVITTHYDDIIKYSYNNPNILLSSVGFDITNLKPTYKYIEDSVGSSNALDIASRYFTDSKIIDKAREFLIKNKTNEDDLIKRLSDSVSQNEILKEELDNKVKQYESLVNEYNTKINAFEDEKTKLKNDYKEKLNDSIEELVLKAQNIIDNINKENAKQSLKNIENIKENIVKEKVTFEIGDNVKVGDGEQIGTIISIDNDKVEVNIRGMNIKTKLSNLTKMPKVKTKQQKGDRKALKSVPKELNLVGERVEEGLEKLEVYLDDAFGASYTTVKIIHGIGTGQLRGAIRDKLKRLKYVKSFNNGDFYDGGSAVTIVEFKR